MDILLKSLFNGLAKSFIQEAHKHTVLLMPVDYILFFSFALSVPYIFWPLLTIFRTL